MPEVFAKLAHQLASVRDAGLLVVEGALGILGYEMFVVFKGRGGSRDIPR
jgi:hypothetical protein